MFRGPALVGKNAPINVAHHAEGEELQQQPEASERRPAVNVHFHQL